MIYDVGKRCSIIVSVYPNDRLYTLAFDHNVENISRAGGTELFRHERGRNLIQNSLSHPFSILVQIKSKISI